MSDYHLEKMKADEKYVSDLKSLQKRLPDRPAPISNILFKLLHILIEEKKRNSSWMS